MFLPLLLFGVVDPETISHLVGKGTECCHGYKGNFLNSLAKAFGKLEL